MSIPAPVGQYEHTSPCIQYEHTSPNMRGGLPLSDVSTTG